MHITRFIYRKVKWVFIWIVWSAIFINGALGADTTGLAVHVMEGDSITLCTGVQTNQNKIIKWYCNTDRIAVLIGYQHKICTNDTCPQRLRDRIRVDNHTGSLTIMKISTADSGHYALQMLNFNREVIFRVVVFDNSSEELEILKRKSVTEGESITLDTPIKTTPNDVLKWYFGEILLAEITGDQSQICEDVQCKDGEQGFRDRLKVNHSSGSLTIMNSSKADSGEYTLLINSTSFYINGSFTVIITVPVVSVLRLSLSTGIGICAGVLVLLTVAAITIYFTIKKHNRTTHQGKSKQENGNGMKRINQNDETDFLRTDFATKTSHDDEETRSTTSVNKTSNNQEYIPFINEEPEDEYKPGIPVIQPEKGVILG